MLASLWSSLSLDEAPAIEAIEDGSGNGRGGDGDGLVVSCERIYIWREGWQLSGGRHRGLTVNLVFGGVRDLKAIGLIVGLAL